MFGPVYLYYKVFIYLSGPSPFHYLLSEGQPFTTSTRDPQNPVGPTI
jgi:hypothetical protein